MKNFLVIGMGELGKHLAEKLNELGNEVCVVDNSPEKINMMSNTFTNAFVGDCTQEVTLRELGINNYDVCVVAIGQNFQASLEITSHLKELGAKFILSKATSEIQSKFLRMAGANDIIYPEKDIAEKIAVTYNAQNLFDYIEVTEKCGIYEIKALNCWVNKSLVELDIRNKYNVNIIAVRKQNEVILPTADYVFNGDDHVFVIGDTSNINKITKKIL